MEAHTHILINSDTGVIIGVVTDNELHDWKEESVVDFYMKLSLIGNPSAHDN